MWRRAWHPRSSSVQILPALSTPPSGAGLQGAVGLLRAP
eukprot:CAMPEP_0171218158 /NCGR_PEP_ID=MMETSP0790-20130122/33060_1 /TAXON_ID=2925 /ORGANISM="Alexandrium catenella, Strain OF101" /LENGTH=38 /DNA_ID= /DNA_START= /DNA_END= /DNA_ORIENTATION=